MFGAGLFTSALGGGGGGGGGASSAQTLDNKTGDLSGQFGDVNLGFGANKNQLMIIAGAAVLIVAMIFLGRK
jgi:hypothetical protein